MYKLSYRVIQMKNNYLFLFTIIIKGVGWA